MFEKIWDNHVVHAEPGKQTILYIDLQLVHEVTSPQAFESCAWPVQGSAAGADHRHRRSQRAYDRSVVAHRRSDLKQQIDTLRETAGNSALSFMI